MVMDKRWLADGILTLAVDVNCIAAAQIGFWYGFVVLDGYTIFGDGKGGIDIPLHLAGWALFVLSSYLGNAEYMDWTMIEILLRGEWGISLMFGSHELGRQKRKDMRSCLSFPQVCHDEVDR